MELNTMKLHREQRLPGPFASPWLVIGGAVILGAAILVMTLRNLDRDGKQMARIPEKNGASLIKALERAVLVDATRHRAFIMPIVQGDRFNSSAGTNLNK